MFRTSSDCSRVDVVDVLMSHGDLHRHDCNEQNTSSRMCTDRTSIVAHEDGDMMRAGLVCIFVGVEDEDGFAQGK